jgi:hypothetical protein
MRRRQLWHRHFASVGVSRMTMPTARDRMEKTPAGGDRAGVSYRTGAGDLGDGERPALLRLSLGVLQGCIKQLTLNLRWISGITFHQSRRGREAQSARDNRRAHGAKATEPAAQFQSWLTQRNRPHQGLSTPFPAISGNCLASVIKTAHSRGFRTLSAAYFVAERVWPSDHFCATSRFPVGNAPGLARRQ